MLVVPVETMPWNKCLLAGMLGAKCTLQASTQLHRIQSLNLFLEIGVGTALVKRH